MWRELSQKHCCWLDEASDELDDVTIIMPSVPTLWYVKRDWGGGGGGGVGVGGGRDSPFSGGRATVLQ